MSVNGILNVNKPAGMTSFDVVAAMRRITGERRVGHAGTLDPLATGVLPVCVGQATRVVEYLTGSNKSYRAEMALGVSTDTDDAEGRIIAQADPSGISQEQLEQAISSFLGKIDQIPPAYSAIKVGGKRLYELARRGTEVDISPRQVEIYDIRLLCFELPVAVIEVECSKGTYIRSLARDIGNKLGVGAHLSNLVRTRSGPFTIDDAMSLQQITLAFELDYWRSIIYPMDEALLLWNAIIVGPEREQDICNGRPFPAGDSLKVLGLPAALSEAQPANTSAERCRAYGFDGRLLAVLNLDRSAEIWRPIKVLCLQG